MDINSLYTLIAIAEHGSFAEAARQLNLSDSTVSLQVAAMERESGKVIFDRSHRPPSFTSAGLLFVQGARDVVRQWEQLKGTHGSGQMTGALKIGAVHTVVTDSLPGALLELRKQAPELSVRLVTGLTNDLLNRVVKHNLDCAIITIPDHIPPQVACFPVYSDPLVVIAHTGAKGKTARALLENNPYVRFSPHAEVARIVDRLLRDRNVRVNAKMEIDTLDAVVSLVRNGLGVSVVPAGRALPGNLRVVQFTKPRAVRNVGVVTHRDSTDKGIIELLVELLRCKA